MDKSCADPFGSTEKKSPVIQRTTKCSIGSIIQSQAHLHAINLLTISMSQISAIATRAIEDHLCTTLENGRNIDWVLNQSYFMMAYYHLVPLPETSSQRGKDPKVVQRKLEVYQSVQKVLADMNHPNILSVPAGRTCYAQLCTAAAKDMVTAYKVHAVQRLRQSLDCWLRAHIIASMSDEEYADPRKYIPVYMTYLDEMPFYDVYIARKKTIERWLKNYEDDGVADASKTRAPIPQLITMMWHMRTEVEELSIGLDRPMKTIAVFPNADLRDRSIQLYTDSIVEIHKYLAEISQVPMPTPPKPMKQGKPRKARHKGSKRFNRRNRANKAKQRTRCPALHAAPNPESKRSKCLVKLDVAKQIWNQVFNVQEIQKLRPGWTVGDSIRTDGVYACIGFDSSAPKDAEEEKKQPVKRASTKETQAKIATELQKWEDEEKQHSEVEAKKRKGEVLNEDVPPSKRSRGSAVKPKKVPTKRKRVLEPDEFKSKRLKKFKVMSQLKPGLYSEKDILKQYEKVDPNVSFVSIDPGINTIVQGWSIREQKPVVRWTMKQLEHEAGRNSKQVSDRRFDHLSRTYEAMQSSPYRRWVHPDKRREYLQMLGSVWDRIWAYESSKKGRRLEFRQWSKEQQAMAKFMARVKSEIPPEKTTILFGNGGGAGQFQRLRNGKRKPPTMKLKRLLAKEYPVICVNEFRTSKLCMECGLPMEHPRKGQIHALSYCASTMHARVVKDRDVDAAEKIGYRFLCQLLRKPLGPWACGSELLPGVASDALFHVRQLVQNHAPSFTVASRGGSRTVSAVRERTAYARQICNRL